MKNPARCGISHVEPRGIEPLCQSVDFGFLTVRWPLMLHAGKTIILL